jgi:hypothetical protein
MALPHFPHDLVGAVNIEREFNFSSQGYIASCYGSREL